MTKGRESGPAENIEREVKLSAWPGFELPELADLPGGVRAEPAAEREFDTAHYDTSDLRLIRSGVTVRFRSDERPPWTVKLPEGDGDGGDGALIRRELRYDGDESAVPPEISASLAAYRRAAPLEPVAHLHTVRRRLRLVDEDGQVVGEVDDDEVSVLDLAAPSQEGDARVAARFREVEAEIGDGASDDLLPALVSRLREAGAGAPDPTPKVLRALGPRALAPADVAPVELDGDSTGEDVVRAAIAAATLRIVEHDLVVRRDTDPEGVHQMRVGARRLRSDLRTLAPLLDRGWSDPVREELRWLGRTLGPVRDADVLAARLLEQAAELPAEDRPYAEAIVQRLRRERRDALADAHAALDGKRYAALLERLVEGAGQPPVTPDVSGPARELLPPLVSVAWDGLDKAVDHAGRHPTDGELHAIRIRAKRARYAAEVAAPVIGKPAGRLASRLADLQDVLGGHQDGRVAEEWLRVQAKGFTRPQSLVAGELIASQRAESRALRSGWPKVWRTASKEKLRAWLQ